MNDIRRIQDVREELIDLISNSNNKVEMFRKFASNLYNLDLTVYSKNYSMESSIYNALSESIIDSNINLHPEQQKILTAIDENNATIVSAPTSFGKTFCVFEYIARNKPKNVMLVVPTLALVEEYLSKIIRKYESTFYQYKIHTNINTETEIDFDLNNVFIVTHDRVVSPDVFLKFKSIDFLVIDEIYKLENNADDDRTLVLNMAYHYLSKVSSKYVLLAPFISGVSNLNQLEKEPIFIKTDYSPVVNKVNCVENVNGNVHEVTFQLLRDISGDKTLVYFPTVTNLASFVKYLDERYPIEIEHGSIVRNFIKWAEDEIHPEWYILKALRKGFLIHNGQLQMGTRMINIDLYESSQFYNVLLCTSTLLEGVNTTAKNIIITKPYRGRDELFTSFDFYNLVGRTGRLNQHLVGEAYYIVDPDAPQYEKQDALREVIFEISENTQDIMIQTETNTQDQEYQTFLSKLDITDTEYKENIGCRLRFKTVKKIQSSLSKHMRDLISELEKYKADEKRGRYFLIEKLNAIVNNPNTLQSSIITSLLNKQKLKLRTVIEKTKKHFKKVDLDYIISLTIRLKTGIIEHNFYSKINVLKYLLSVQNTEKTYLNILDNKILHPIEYIYYIKSKEKRMLIDLGIYDRDVDKIINFIGDDFKDVLELKRRLVALPNTKRRQLSYISRYIIIRLTR